MKKRVIGLLTAGFMISAAVSAQAQETDTLRLTLSQALEVALSENLTVKIADQEIEKQEYAKKGTYAALFPQISLDGSYQRTIKKQTMYMDGMGDSENSSIQVGRDNSWSGGLSASMPLVSPTLWKSLKISGYDVEMAIEKARSSRIEMAAQVKQAFYTVLLARESLSVYEDAYRNAVENYNDIQRKLEQGSVAEYDLIRANVNVKNAEPNVYDAQNSLIIAHWQLKALLGLDLEIEVECIGSLPAYETELMPVANEDFDLEGNSGLRQLDVQGDIYQKTIEMRRAAYYPTLSASFNYDWTSMNNNFKFSSYKWNPYSIAGLTLSIPVFSGGQRSAQTRQARIDLGNLNLERQETERNLQVSARQSADQMNTCIKQYHAARAGVEESERGYTITMKRYETGEGTMLEINDSQLSLTQARLNLNQSIYNYLVARSELEKTLGTIIEQQ